MIRKAKRFLEASLRASEEYASTVLAGNWVLATAAIEAAQGHRVAFIPIERPIDIQATEAAKELKTKLEAEGFTLEWRKRSVFVAGNEMPAWSLAIMW